MRAWVAMVALVAGCAGAEGGGATAANDPLALPEAPLAVETLPGALVGPWPLPIARGAGGWLVPFFADGELQARFVGDDGARVDRVIDDGTLVGATALADGFAIAAADAGQVGQARVHFLGSDGNDAVVAMSLDGNAVPGIASDGARVLLAATTGGDIAVDGPRPLAASLALVDRRGARVIELGAVDAAPAPWGDANGFVVGGTLLVDGGGAIAPAPGHQVRDARVFRMPIAAGSQPTSDTISLGDKQDWLHVDGLVGWAGRDAGVARLEVVTQNGRALVEVGDDLTPRARLALPSTTLGDGGQSWVAAADGAHVVWASTRKNDPVFAILDASAMQPTSGLYRIRNSTSRTPIVSLGGSGVLFAWTEADGVVRYAVVRW